MKIALVVPGGVDESGSKRIIPALVSLIQRLSREHEVTVFALRQYPEFRRYRLFGAEIVNLGDSAGWLPGQGLSVRIGKIVRLARDEGRSWDLLHAFWVGSASNLALTLGALWKRPVVVSLGGGEVANLPNIAYGGGRRATTRLSLVAAGRRASHITVGSTFLQRLAADKIAEAQVVPLGIDTAFWSVAAEPPPGPPWRLVQVASLNRVKDPELMLEVLSGLICQGVEARLDWIGEDTLDGRIQQLAIARGLDGHIVFHGFLEQARLIEVLRQAHIYVQTSLYESQGVSVCEAAALGIPVAGTAVGLVSDWAPAGAAASPPGDAAALTANVLRLIDDPDERRRLGSAGKSWVMAHDADWTAERFIGIYRNLLADRGR